MAAALETRSREFLVPSSSRRTDSGHAESSRGPSAIRRLPSHSKIGRAASASATVVTSTSTLTSSPTSRNSNQLALKPKDNLRRVASNVMHGPRPPPPRRSPQNKSTFSNENSSPSSLHKARSSPHLSSLDLPRVEAGPSNSARKQDAGSPSKHLVSASMSSSSVDKPTSGSRLRHKTTASSLTSHTSHSSLRKGSNTNSQQSHHNSPVQKSQSLTVTAKDVKPSPKSSGNTSDSSFSRRGSAHPLDMKRLLSKPAPQSPSPHSATSAPEWDLHRRTSISHERDTVFSAQRRGRSRGACDLEENKTSPRHDARSSPTLRLPFPSSSGPATPRAQGRSGFLNDKGGASPGAHHRRASDVTEMQAYDKEENYSPTNMLLKPKVSRRPSTANDIDPRPPPGLTPAGAVVHAYKVQEQRRKAKDDLDEPSSPKPYNNKSRRAASATANFAGEEEESDSHAPYYTVLGGTTGRTVAIGSALDSVWDHYLSDVSGHRGPSTASSLKRNVSRKLSGKWKKKDNDGGDKPAGVADDGVVIEKPQDDTMDKFNGLLKDGKAVLNLSMDGLGFKESSIKSSKHLSAEKPWTTTKSAFELDTVWKIEKDGDTYGDRIKAKKKSIVDDTSAAGKLWKLVKKLSSGTLKDHHRHHQPSDVPPPVPSLPKEVLQSLIPSHQPQQQSASPDINPDSNTNRRSSSRTSRPRPSLSLRPSTAPSPTRRRPSIPFITPVMTPTQDQTRNVSSSSGAKIGTATASSSPVSSQSHLFNRAHSPQSSSSSYGEELLPSIHASLKQEQESPSNSRPENFWKSIPMLPPISTDNKFKVVLPAEEMPSLFQEEKESNTPPDSPTIPTFSTEHTVNSFPPRRPSADHSSRLPDHLRNISGSNSPVQSHIASTPRKMSNSSFMSDFEDLGRNNIVFPELSKPSKVNGNHSPARRRSVSQGRDDSLFGTPRRSTAGSPTSTNTVTPSPMVFRDMKESRQAWSEQEKVDKWDDLLLRSAKAGGTLHVGLEKLMSDDISLSSF